MDIQYANFWLHIQYAIAKTNYFLNFVEFKCEKFFLKVLLLLYIKIKKLEVTRIISYNLVFV
jgi:hypothetical protein